MLRAIPSERGAESSVLTAGQVGLASLGAPRRHRPRGQESRAVKAAAGVPCVATGRVDYRQELIGRLVGEDGRPLTGVADASEILVAAYRRWQHDAPTHLLGDWALAAWDPTRRELFLARDRFAGTPLYYVACRGFFAFATSKAALLALDGVPNVLDERWLAQLLLTWDDEPGDRTVQQHIRLLPPAHTLTASAGTIDVRRYWRMEDISELRLPTRGDYVEQFVGVFGDAVRDRLPESGPVGVTLSGGLDSSAVAAMAATSQLGQAHRLVAFTSVPVFDPTPYVGSRFGDEFDLASATAKALGPMRHVAVRGLTWSPIGAVRRVLEMSGEPMHAASNLFWLLDVFDTARRFECSTLLTGQAGNMGISWPGDVSSQSTRYRLQHLGIRVLARSRLRAVAPARVRQARARRAFGPEWYRTSAISPTFARRLDLADRHMAEGSASQVESALERRLRILAPSRSRSGELWSQFGTAFGVEQRDPTADVRVLSFTLSVPDHIFIDPETGLDRWLVREAMRDRVPDEVRLNRRRGRQSGDLVHRLRANSAEVDAALGELATGPAPDYLDVAYMGEVWDMVKSVDSPEAHRKAVAILVRGIMAGLYVNGLAG